MDVAQIMSAPIILLATIVAMAVVYSLFKLPELAKSVKVRDRLCIYESGEYQPSSMPQGKKFVMGFMLWGCDEPKTVEMGCS